MSLNQKYTWHDFLKEHPEHKEKKTKRTSPEGKKAFEAAYKTHIKAYLIERDEMVGKQIEKSTKKRGVLIERSKTLRKAGHTAKLNITLKKVGRADSAIARLGRQRDKNKTMQKEFK